MILEIFVRIRTLCDNLFLKEDFLPVHARLLTNVEFTCVSHLIRSQVSSLTLAEHRIFHYGRKVMEDQMPLLREVDLVLEISAPNRCISLYIFYLHVGLYSNLQLVGKLFAKLCAFCRVPSFLSGSQIST